MYHNPNLKSTLGCNFHWCQESSRAAKRASALSLLFYAASTPFCTSICVQTELQGWVRWKHLLPSPHKHTETPTSIWFHTPLTVPHMLAPAQGKGSRQAIGTKKQSIGTFTASWVHELKPSVLPSYSSTLLERFEAVCYQPSSQQQAQHETWSHPFPSPAGFVSF